MHFPTCSDWSDCVTQGFLALLVGVMILGLGDDSYAAGVKWGYSGDIGPEHWGRDFTMCGLGRNQAPIDITPDHLLDNDQETIGSRPAGFLTINTNFREVPLQIINNGHTVEVEYETGSTLTVHGKTRELKQFHFHSPSGNDSPPIRFSLGLWK